MKTTINQCRDRYYNIAAITTQGSTISTQVWANNFNDAERVLLKWIEPDQERWNTGRVAFASIYDTLLKDVTYYQRNRDGLEIVSGTTK
jgi:hypothetical protein